jgi:hypothetical protein
MQLFSPIKPRPDCFPQEEAKAPQIILSAIETTDIVIKNEKALFNKATIAKTNLNSKPRALAVHVSQP